MPTTERFEEIRKMDLSQVKRRVLEELSMWHRGRDKRANKWELIEKVFSVTIPEDQRNQNNHYDRQYRLAVGELRNEGELICTDSAGGPWYAESIDDAFTTVLELEGRAKDLFDTARKLKESALRLFGGQGRLL